MSKEFLSSLPEVMDHYSQCNLLLPTSTDVQLNPWNLRNYGAGCEKTSR